jgi:hypothetical protein
MYSSAESSPVNTEEREVEHSISTLQPYEEILKKIHDVSENKKKKYQVNIIFNDIKDLEKNLELIKSKFINNDSLDELLIKRKEYKPRGKKPNNGGNNSPPVMISN